MRYILNITSCLILFTSPVASQFSTVLTVPPDAIPTEIGSDTQLNLMGGELSAGFRAGAASGFGSNT